MAETHHQPRITTDPALLDSPSRFFGARESELDAGQFIPHEIVEGALEYSGEDKLAVLSEVASQTKHLTIRQKLAALDALELTGVSPGEIRTLKGDLVRHAVARQAVRASLPQTRGIKWRSGL